jgi:hypothetical protein
VLNAAFSSDFEEGRSQTYRFEDIRASAFRLLVQWLYTKKIDTERDFNSDSVALEDPEIEKLQTAQDLDLVQLWIVADRLLIPSLQNQVMKELSSLWGFDGLREPTTKWIAHAYEHTAPGSPLRLLAVDVSAYLLRLSRFEDSSDFPHEMLFDLAKHFCQVVQPITAAGSYRTLEFGVIDEKGKRVKPDGDELFFAGDKFSCVRVMRNYLVPEDD